MSYIILTQPAVCSIPKRLSKGSGEVSERLSKGFGKVPERLFKCAGKFVCKVS